MNLPGRKLLTPREQATCMLAWARSAEAGCLRDGNIPGAMRYARLAALAESRLAIEDELREQARNYPQAHTYDG